MPAAPRPTISTSRSSILLAGELERVQQRGEDDDRGAVLVVVEDRDVERSLEALLDLEAAGRADVLEVDAAEGGGDGLDGRDDLVRVLGAQAEREGVDAAELLEQHRLPLHDRHRRLGPDVAEPEDGAAVGDDGHRVALDRVLEGLVAVVGDRLADAGDAGRVGHAQVVAGAQRVLVVLLDLAADVHQERAVGGVDAPRRRRPRRPRRRSAWRGRCRRRRRSCRKIQFSQKTLNYPDLQKYYGTIAPIIRILLNRQSYLNLSQIIPLTSSLFIITIFL